MMTEIEQKIVAAMVEEWQKYPRTYGLTGTLGQRLKLRMLLTWRAGNTKHKELTVVE